MNHIHTFTQEQGPTLVTVYTLFITFHNYSLLAFLYTKKPFLKLIITLNTLIIMLRGVEINSASKYIKRVFYLLLKASRCVFSIKSPLSIMVRLEWESCSRLLEAIIRLSIHLLINSCSFSRPVLPVIPVQVNYIGTALEHILTLRIKKRIVLGIL